MMLKKLLSLGSMDEIKYESYEDTQEFLTLSNEFHSLEEKLQNLSKVLVKHCNALEEINETVAELAKVLPEMYPTNGVLNSMMNDMRSNNMIDMKGDCQVQMIREKVISPLQSLLGGFPKLKLRLNHRRGALDTMKRYERKLLLISKKGETSRMQRNRNKLSVAKERFHLLNEEVTSEIQGVLSCEIQLILDAPLINLINLQTEWSKLFTSSCEHIQQVMNQNLEDNERKQVIYAATNHKKTKSLTERSNDKNQNNEENQNSIKNEKNKKDQQEYTLEEDNMLKEENGMVPQEKTKTSSLSSTPTHHSASLSKSFSKQAPPSPILSRKCENNVMDSSHLDRVLPLTSTLILDKRRSLCPKKKHVYGTRTWNLHQHIKVSMASGLDIRECVELPSGFTLDEWVCVHVIDFFNEINLLYGTITEFCTDTSCPEMTAGTSYTYLWADGIHHKSPKQLSAPDYIRNVMGWAENIINDPQVFPTSSKFMESSKNILKRLFRIYAHIYHSHLEHFISLKAEGHLNFCFKRFVYFVQEFQLVDKKELNALRKLINKIMETPTTTLTTTTTAN